MRTSNFITLTDTRLSQNCNDHNMILRIIFVAATLSNAALGYEDIVNIGQHLRATKNRHLTSCSSYPINFPVTTQTTVQWNGGGGLDKEWINVKNWQYQYLPGVHKYNRVVMAGLRTQATVHCPATYMQADVDVEIRTKATLDIQADLSIGGKLKLQYSAAVTQSSQSIVSIGKMLHLAANYDLSDQARLDVGSNIYVPTSGRLAINGDSAIVSAEEDSEMHGWLTYRFGPTGAGSIEVNGGLKVGAWAKLVIDASSYDWSSSAGTRTLQLIKYSNPPGANSFASDNVDFTGLPDGWAYQLRSETHGLYLELTQGGNPTTGTPTTAPTTGAPTTAPTTAAPTTAPTLNPTSAASSYPTGSPSITTSTTPTTAPSLRPVTSPNSTNSPISHPTGSPSTLPSMGESPSSSPTESVIPGPTPTFVLSASGVDTITNNGSCPAQDIEELVIDGTAYTAGPSILTLYECANINTGFDAMKFKLIGFQSGLWFEIVNRNDRVDLVIKSLYDYSQYWNQVKNSYTGDYPPQESTDKFPEFSWEFVPRWISFRKNPNKGPFTEEDINSIASNNHISWFGLGAPEDVIQMAESIKVINPKYKMLLYWNSESYWGSDIDTFQEEWLEPGVVGTGDRPSYDHSIPEMRSWWIQHAVEMDQNTVIDGVFADNTREPAETDKSQMIQLLAETLPDNSLKMGNFLRQRDANGNRWRMNYEDGSYFENQHVGPVNQPEHESIIVSMQLAREASWKRKLVMWNGSRRNCGCGNIHPSQIPATCVGFMNVNEAPEQKILDDLNLSLAEYFMVAEEFSYFSFNVSPDASCERWRWDSSDLPQFSKPLGRPLGPPLQIGHTFTRHFEHLSVKVNLDTSETTFHWDSE